MSASRNFETHLANPTTPLEREIAQLGPWFHNLHLPGGAQTAPDHPLGDFPAFKWRKLAAALPEDLSGWRVLDVGCNAGYYSFELARRGADVLGVDADAKYLRQARWAAKHQELRGSVRFEQRQAYELVDDDARFDLILFMGLFYHLRYPVLVLDALARRTRRLMVFQSVTMPGEDVHDPPYDLSIEDRDELLEPGWPRMALIEHRLSGDPTNWWVMNHAAAEALLRSAGLAVVSRPAHEIYVCEPHPQAGESESVMRAREQFDALRAALGRR